jgi:hypothetical protein
MAEYTGTVVQDVRQIQEQARLKAASAKMPEDSLAELSPISRAILDQDNAIGNISEALDMLTERLQPILAPENSVPANDTAKASRTYSQVGNTLENNNERLGMLVDRIFAIKRRVEL